MLEPNSENSFFEPCCLQQQLYVQRKSHASARDKPLPAAYYSSKKSFIQVYIIIVVVVVVVYFALLCTNIKSHINPAAISRLVYVYI